MYVMQIYVCLDGWLEFIIGTNKTVASFIGTLQTGVSEDIFRNN
jgi:hypothetical protein